MTALWLAANLHNGQLNGWMSIIAAVDCLFLLRLSGSGRGWPSTIGSLLTVLVTAFASVWTASGIRLGRVMGMTPADSLGRMDPLLPLEVIRHTAGWIDITSIAIAIVLCLIGTRKRQR